MGLYKKYILPKITDYLCGGSPSMKQREKVVPLARGTVLEIGIGSGLNLQYLNEKEVSRIYGLDPSKEMWKLAKANVKQVSIPVEYIHALADEIPLTDGEVDTILVTYTLCSIPNVGAALKEMKRVLCKDGQLIFCEHGLAPHRSVRAIQRMINPIWSPLGGGCSLTKKIPDLITENGYHIQSLQTMYIPGFKPASYNYWGVAIPK